MTGPLWLWWQQGDAVARGTALLLLALSVASWVVIVWKIWFMAASRRRVPQAIAAFWSAPDLATGQARMAERSEEHTSELQSPCNLVCRLLLEKKKKNQHVMHDQ